MTACASQNKFMRLSKWLLPLLSCIGGVLLAAGTYLALITSPADYQQSESVRIMYVHVPAAWMALTAYASLAIAALVGFVWRHPLAELYCRASAPLGAVFTALCLATGMLWGKPMWGTWWVWDARLTSVLVLLFLYLGYIALVHAFDDPKRGLRAGSILLMAGSVNLPIIKFSVDWWNTLHQGASLSSLQRLTSPGLHITMMPPLLLMALAYSCIFAALAIVRLKGEIAENRLHELMLQRLGSPYLSFASDANTTTQKTATREAA